MSYTFTPKPNANPSSSRATTSSGGMATSTTIDARASILNVLNKLPSTKEETSRRNKEAIEQHQGAIRRMLRPIFKKHSSTTCHVVTTEFRPDRGCEKYTKELDQTVPQIHELCAVLQNFAENQTTQRQTHCPVSLDMSLSHTLTGELYTAGDGRPGRTTDTSAILATHTAHACEKLRILIKSLITINSPVKTTEGIGTAGDDGAPAKVNLNATLDAEPGGRGGEVKVDETPAPMSDEDKSRMRSAAKSILAASTNHAALDAADVGTTTPTTKSGQPDVVAGDLTSVLSIGDIKVVEHLGIYKFITTEALASGDMSKATKDPDDLAYILIATNIGETTGFFDEEGFNMNVLGERLGSPQAIYDVVVNVLCDYMDKLNDENIRLTENCMKNTDEWRKLVQAYEKVLDCDVWLAIGGGRQIQAHFNMCKRITNYLLNSNKTPQIKKYLRSQDTRSYADGSAAGNALGVIEYMGNTVGGIDELINGKLNAFVIQAYVNENSTIPMMKNELATQYCDRVKSILYDDVVTMSKNSANLDKVVDNLARSGLLDLVKTILTGTRSAAHVSHDIRNVCASYALNRSNYNLPVNGRSTEEQLDDFHELRQELAKVEARELIYNPPTRGPPSGKNQKLGYQKPRSLREFAAAAIHGNASDDTSDESDDVGINDDGGGPPETAVIAELKGQIDQLTTAMAAFTKAQAKPNNGNQVSAKTPAEKKAARLQKYSSIVSNDFKQLSFDEDMICEYCNRKGHKQGKCARFAWDLTHDQMNAHAGVERIEYLKSKGYNSHQPAPGSFKVYPHGNGNGPAAKKPDDDTIAELQKQISDLKAKNQGGKKAEKYAALIQAITEMGDGSDSDDE